ncbi:hypothetical protein OS42_46570 [Dickeya oryzae]
MISVKNLTKRFGDQVVLDNISLDIAEGEVVAIIGPSGSGKSTLLRCLNLLEKPESGVITIGEQSLDTRRYSSKDAYALRRQTAMVFQNYNLFKNKTALENITEALIVVKKIAKKQADENWAVTAGNGRAVATSASIPGDALWRSAAACQYRPCVGGGPKSDFV